MYVIRKDKVTLRYRTIKEAVDHADEHMFLSRAQWHILSQDGYPFEYRGWTVEKIETKKED